MAVVLEEVRETHGEEDFKGNTETLKLVRNDPFGQVITTSYLSFLKFDEIQPGSNLELKGWFSDKGKHCAVSYANLLTDILLDDQSSSGRDTERVDNDEFSYVLQQLDRLTEPPIEEVDDSGGALIPTIYSIEIARRLLNQSYGLLQGSFTRASVTTSFEGGIRIEWISPVSSVRAIVPEEARSKGYIYYESGESFGTKDLTADNLIELLLKTF